MKLMPKIIVKGALLNGRMAGPADKYEDSYSGPTNRDIERTYQTIQEFCIKYGREVIPQVIRHFPFIDEGVIMSSAVAACYQLNDCLVAHGQKPHLFGIAYMIQIAGENEKTIDGNLIRIKNWADWGRKEYWQDTEKRIIEVPHKLEEAVVRCLTEST